MKNLFFGLVIFFTAIGCSNDNSNDKSDFGKPTQQHKIAVSDSNIIKVYVQEVE